MGSITIISGSPGTGKTTIAARLAAASDRGVHVVTDRFYEFVAHRIDPSTEAADAQNRAVIRAVIRSAAAFADAGYEVFVDGVVGPWMLPLVREEYPLSLHYVVLRADLDTVRRQASARQGQPDATAAIVETMHAQFVDLGAWESHVVETAERTPDAIAAEILDHRSAGALRI